MATKAKSGKSRRNLSFSGWRRENGRVGVRNHVVILPLDDLSNAACEAVANNIKGTLALPHAYGRLQFGADLDLHFRTLIGTGSNPNVAAVVVIGIEDGWTKRVVDGIAKTGKPVVGFGIEGHGDIAIIAKASYKAKEFVQWASELEREECDIEDLWVSTKCGESDTTTGLSSCPTVGNMYDKLIPKGIYGCFGETSEITGAEHIAKSRAINAKIGEKWMKVFQAYQDEVIEANKVDDLSDSQPTKGNIAGGLTTIEEKASCNLEKIGRKCKYIEVLEPAEAPKDGPGLYYMGGVIDQNPVVWTKRKNNTKPYAEAATVLSARARFSLRWRRYTVAATMGTPWPSTRAYVTPPRTGQRPFTTDTARTSAGGHRSVFSAFIHGYGLGLLKTGI